MISIDSPPDLGQPSDPNRLTHVDQDMWNEDAQAWHEFRQASQPKRPADPLLGNASSPPANQIKTESAASTPRRAQGNAHEDDEVSVASSGRTPTGPITESPTKKPRTDDKDLDDDGKDFSSPTQEFFQSDGFKETLPDGSPPPAAADHDGDGSRGVLSPSRDQARDADMGPVSPHGSPVEIPTLPMDQWGNAELYGNIVTDLTGKMNEMNQQIELMFKNALTENLKSITSGLADQLGQASKRSDEKLTAHMKKQEKKDKDIQNQLSATNKDLKTFANRLDALEARRDDPRPSPKKKKAPPGASGASDDMDEDQSSPIGSSPKIRIQLSKPKPLPNPYEKFVPQTVLIRGWCKFKENRGLSQADAKGLGARILQLLDPETRKLVLSTEAPYTVNRQVVFRVRDGGEHCWTLRKKIMDCLDSNPVSVKGRNVFCSVEPSPSARAKNTLVAKASSTLENSLTSDSAKHMIVDVRAGCIYHIPNPDVQDGWTEVGRATRTGTWLWLDAALSCWPELDLLRLRADTDALVSE